MESQVKRPDPYKTIKVDIDTHYKLRQRAAATGEQIKGLIDRLITEEIKRTAGKESDSQESSCATA